MTTLVSPPTRIVAHRGFSSRQPEMTLAAYQEAVDWARAEAVPVGLECDVHFSADGQVVCLHDDGLSRTCGVDGLVGELTLAELRGLDFGSWRIPDPSPPQRSLVTLADLLVLVHEAREQGVDVTLVVETKHEVDRAPEIELEVCRMLAEHGWNRGGAPVRLITFCPVAAALLAQLVPDVDRTLLVELALGPYASGELPAGIHVVGVDIHVLREHPDFVARAREHGNEVHVWTVNEIADIEFCRSIGVTCFTTDYPDRVLEVLSRAEVAG